MQRRDGSHHGITLSKTERHQTALRGRALTRSRVRTASSLPPSGECWTSRLRNLSVPTNRSRKSMSSASAEERRATRPAPWESRPACTFGVAWLLPRRLPLVFTRSSGRNSLAARCPVMLVQSKRARTWIWRADQRRRRIGEAGYSSACLASWQVTGRPDPASWLPALRRRLKLPR